MKTYTVIGVYDDGQAFADEASGEDPHDAMRRLARALEGGLADLTIVAAIEGRHAVAVPCEDSGRVAYACDLIE